MTSPTFNKTHAITVVATAAIEANRFVCLAGTHAPAFAAGAAANLDVVGVSETSAAAGDAFAATTAYSQLVEASEAIAVGDLVKPAADGKAAKGTQADHCGRAHSAATAAGALIEVQILPHRHA